MTNYTSLRHYCQDWIGETGLEPWDNWSIAEAHSELSTVQETFPHLTAQELYETMASVLREVRAEYNEANDQNE